MNCSFHRSVNLLLFFEDDGICVLGKKLGEIVNVNEMQFVLCL